jgi:uncharacterized protein (TIGR03084 family)
MREICDDLAAEQAALDAVAAGLDAAAWATPTPAPGWTVHDQIGHLAYYDVAACLAAVDPGAFHREAAAIPRENREQHQLATGRRLGPTALLAWWRDSRASMLAAFRVLDAKARVPWFGPTMSARSFATARLEETWGHGQDVADALGVSRPATHRLRHVAHLGVLTRAFSFTNNGRAAPAADVRVELRAPSGARWTWGDPGSPDRVTGSALGFCLVVTRRRHVADTDLVAEGTVAREWLQIAQAFAGPGGSGRQPGQFPRLREE